MLLSEWLKGGGGSHIAMGGVEAKVLSSALKRLCECEDADAASSEDIVRLTNTGDAAGDGRCIVLWGAVLLLVEAEGGLDIDWSASEGKNSMRIVVRSPGVG